MKTQSTNAMPNALLFMLVHLSWALIGILVNVGDA
jgi:hypothetical protein